MFFFTEIKNQCVENWRNLIENGEKVVLLSHKMANETSEGDMFEKSKIVFRDLVRRV